MISSGYQSPPANVATQPRIFKQAHTSDLGEIRGQKGPMDPGADWRVRRHADVMILSVKRILPILPVRWTVPSIAAQVGPISHEIHEGEMSVDPVLDEEVQQRDSIAVLVVGPSPVGLGRHLQITPGGVKYFTNLAKTRFRTRAAT